MQNDNKTVIRAISSQHRASKMVAIRELVLSLKFVGATISTIKKAQSWNEVQKIKPIKLHTNNNAIL